MAGHPAHGPVVRIHRGHQRVPSAREGWPDGSGPGVEGLALLALSESSTVSDDMGSTRMTKNRRTRSRDDVAVAAVLATGALARQLRRPRRG